MKLKTASPEAVFLFYVTNITQKLLQFSLFSFMKLCSAFLLYNKNMGTKYFRRDKR